MTDILLILGGYLFGSISAAIVVCKLMGLPDPRTEGSRNPGTTNVLRLGGKKAAILTLAGDMLKGLLPVLIARALHAGPEVQAVTALAAFLGHLYPVFFGFQGGKGVATALGVFFGLHWQTGPFRPHGHATGTGAVLAPAARNGLRLCDRHHHRDAVLASPQQYQRPAQRTGRQDRPGLE
jgi:hypothetical protein